MDQIDNNFFLSKVASFVKLAMEELDSLQEKASAGQKIESEAHRKEAAHIVKQEQFRQSLKKAAKALYEADFISTETEQKQFFKKAEENPAYLSSVIEKICNAVDVSLIGAPARVAVREKQAGDYYDPVRIKAFGLDDSNNFLDDI